MSNSSQPKISSIDLPTIKSVDDILKDCMISSGATGADTITLTSDSHTYSYNTTYDYGTPTLTTTMAGAAPTYSVGSSGISTITINGIDANTFSFDYINQEWKNSFPDWSRVQDMCEYYPGLKIAFENFKVFYEMVKDDYDNPTPKK